MTERVYADKMVVSDQIVSPGWVDVQDGFVVDLGGDLPTAGQSRAGEWLLPGFVDLHCHGGAGATFGEGVDAAVTVAEVHSSAGTTAMLASLVSAPIPTMVAQIAELAGAISAGRLGPVRGIHLEGPFLAPDFRGAHDLSALVNPTPEGVAQLVEAGAGLVMMVTLAPELDGATAAIAQLRDAGIVVAVGHTAADYATTAAALIAGAQVLTHAGNAMPEARHREPGPLVAALESPETFLEIVLDGVHLHDAWARQLIFAARDRVALITDAMAAAGSADGGYSLGGLDVRVVDGVARLREGGSIAGSTLTMDAAVRRAIVDLGIDPVLVAKAASTVPAAALGWSGGRIEIGQEASLVVLDEGLAVQRVMRAGAWA